MSGQAIAIDIGTSGIRAQLLDISSGQVLRTRITDHNPLPGSNVMDHLSFAISYGADVARRILMGAVDGLIEGLDPNGLERIAVCGNPIQLSLFRGQDIRDLAYAGKNKLESENIKPVDRRGIVLPGGDLGFSEDIDIIIPPAVKHEIGADALAMMLKSGFLDDDMCMVTDYGTNAEMALKVGDNIYTGSAAAGPALEGQQISCGMLAAPGAVCDMVRTPVGWTTRVLDDELLPHEGPILNLRSDIATSNGLKPIGITGTGVVALMYAAELDERISRASIVDGPLKISRRIKFDDNDLKEAGKAIGAIRAGHMTLMIKAGITQDCVNTMYMAGATGTYVDPIKARALGLVIPNCSRIVQVGNTSLELAKDLALDPDMLDELNELRNRLLTEHTMFAESDVFRDLYIYELGYWNDGMPLNRYRSVLDGYGLSGYLDIGTEADIVRECERDIRNIGSKLDIVGAGVRMNAAWDCSRCMSCVRNCPEGALSFDNGVFSIDTGSCLGTACTRCQDNCPDHVYDYSLFKVGN